MHTNKYYKEQAKIHKALSSEARLKIIDALYKKECSAGELTNLVGLNQSTVSKHLSVLLSSNIVDNRKEGNVVFYKLIAPCLVEMTFCISKIKK